MSSLKNKKMYNDYDNNRVVYEYDLFDDKTIVIKLPLEFGYSPTPHVEVFDRNCKRPIIIDNDHHKVDE